MLSIGLQTALQKCASKCASNYATKLRLKMRFRFGFRLRWRMYLKTSFQSLFWFQFKTELKIVLENAVQNYASRLRFKNAFTEMIIGHFHLYLYDHFLKQLVIFLNRPRPCFNKIGRSLISMTIFNIGYFLTGSFHYFGNRTVPSLLGFCQRNRHWSWKNLFLNISRCRYVNVDTDDVFTDE